MSYVVCGMSYVVSLFWAVGKCADNCDIMGYVLKTYFAVTNRNFAITICKSLS